MAQGYTGRFKMNRPKSSRDLSKLKDKVKTLGWTCRQGLFPGLQVLNVTTTVSTDNIKLTREFIPDTPQLVTIHCVDCSCYSIFHVIDMCRKRWN